MHSFSYAFQINYGEDWQVDWAFRIGFHEFFPVLFSDCIQLRLFLQPEERDFLRLPSAWFAILWIRYQTPEKNQVCLPCFPWGTIDSACCGGLRVNRKATRLKETFWKQPYFFISGEHFRDSTESSWKRRTLWRIFIWSRDCCQMFR